MYEGSALTGIGHVSDWLASCSVCLCGFCHGIMEVWNPQGASTLQELNLKAPTCCSLGVTCNELLPLPTPTAALKSHSNAGTKAPEQGWVWEAVAPLRGSSDCLGRCSSEASLSKKKKKCSVCQKLEASDVYMQHEHFNQMGKKKPVQTGEAVGSSVGKREPEVLHR